MPRDYKHRAQRRKKTKTVSPWTGLFAGLAIGLFIAFLVYLKMQPDMQPRVAAAAAGSAAKTTPAKAPQSAPRKTGVNKPAAPPPRPRFDFYTLLPEMEVVIPEREITGRTEAGIRQVEKPGTYHLQVGAFRGAEQADRFKAELTLLGLETSIQKVTINNTDTFHRVRVGPYEDLGPLNRARQLLNEQGIDSKLIRLAE